jgi:hypothetical protein
MNLEKEKINKIYDLLISLLDQTIKAIERDNENNMNFIIPLFIISLFHKIKIRLKEGCKPKPKPKESIVRSVLKKASQLNGTNYDHSNDSNNENSDNSNNSRSINTEDILILSRSNGSDRSTKATKGSNKGGKKSKKNKTKTKRKTKTKTKKI